MPNFNSLSDLAKYIGSPAGQQKVFGQKDVQQALREASKLLKDIMYEELQAYYASYTPTVYERTYELLNSLRISPLTKVGNEMYIEVYFDREAATHPSIFGGDDAYVAKLLNDGWAWKNNPGIHHLSYYEGFHFVERSLERFSTENRWGFRISKKDVKR